MKVRPRQEGMTEYSAEYTERSNRAMETKKVLLAPDWQGKAMQQRQTQRKSSINDKTISLQFRPTLMGLRVTFYS